MTDTIYERFGARPIINGLGIYTKLGGAIMSPTVWQAMTEANDWMVEMGPLLDATGEHLAKMLGSEAARVVPGVAAGLALSVAACIARGDEAIGERVPDTAGLANGLVVQAGHRYKYLRAAWLSGARPVWAGAEESGTTAEDLEQALAAEGVAAALFPAHLDRQPGTLPLEEFAVIAREHEVPVVIDAAFQSDPPRLLSRFVPHGDLIGVSAKYFYGPNGGGFVYGRREPVAWLAALDFTRFELTERRTFGRAFKLDRHTVVGTIAALEEWFAMDHEERHSRLRRRVRVLEEAARNVPGVEARPRAWVGDEELLDEPVNCLWMRVDPARFGHTAAELHQALYDADPPLVSHLDGDTIVIAVEGMRDGQEEVVAERLRRHLRQG